MLKFFVTDEKLNNFSVFNNTIEVPLSYHWKYTIWSEVAKEFNRRFDPYKFVSYEEFVDKFVHSGQVICEEEAKLKCEVSSESNGFSAKIKKIEVKDNCFEIKLA